jgi:hypothetical protein
VNGDRSFPNLDIRLVDEGVLKRLLKLSDRNLADLGGCQVIVDVRVVSRHQYPPFWHQRITASARFMVMHSESARARADLHSDLRSACVIILMRDLHFRLNFMRSPTQVFVVVIRMA